MRAWAQVRPGLIVMAALFAGGPAADSLRAQGGSLDPEFAENGTFGKSNCGRSVPIGFFCDEGARALVVEPDGGLVIGGHPSFDVRRFAPDGKSALTFAKPGFAASPGEVLALARQPDGKIVAGGVTFTTPSGGFALARYLPDGSVDPSFGAGGEVVMPMGSFGSAIRALAIQPDGKIIAAGYAEFLTAHFALARYLPDGQLDDGFGDGGKVRTGFAGGGFANAVVILPDGRFVVAGSVGATASLEGGWTLVRYLPNGSLDPSFGVLGRYTLRSPFLAGASPFLAGAMGLARQTDGKLVAAGFGRTPAIQAFFTVIRFEANGAVDTTFGAGGAAFAGFGGVEDRASGLAIQADGKIVVAGSSDTTGFALARFLPSGALDPAFGTSGLVRTAFSADPFAVAIQPDGKIVAAGRYSGNPGLSGQAQNMIALARYLP